MADIISRYEYGGWVRNEIRVHYVRPSTSPDHCIEIIIENSEQARRASKLIDARITPDEALRLARMLDAAVNQARSDG